MSRYALEMNKSGKDKRVISVHKSLGAFLLCLLLTACDPLSHSDEITFHTNDVYRSSGFPFSEAVEADGWIFLSGALGTLPGTTDLAPGGIKGEARQVMENIKSTLAAYGLGMERIVKCTVMIDDMADWPTFNEIYKDFFEDDFPARSAFGADGLALGAAVEVECIARR